MAKLTLADLEANYRSVTAFNNNFAAIEAALENTLSRDGTSPNAMSASLDMGSNYIINVTDPVNDQDAATKAYVDDSVAAVADFSNVYLGAKAADPATDNDGNLLVTGALYYNTTDDELRVWDATTFSWQGVVMDDGSIISIISEIDASIRTGDDTRLVTGSAGINGNFVSWNIDGDAVDSAKAVPTGDVVGTSDTQTLSGKTLNGAVIRDDSTIVDNADPTKAVAFQVSGVTTGTTRTLTVPNYDATIATLAGTETFTNKTLTNPELNGTLSGTAFLDEDTMSSNSAIAAASQQSIKAYADNQRVANYTALKALSAGLYSSVLVEDASRGGIFVWRSGDQSANITADPGEGVYVPPNSDATGASGAWQRQYSGSVNVMWWEPARDNSTDDAAKIQQAVNFARSLGRSLYFPGGAPYRIDSNVVLYDITLEGDYLSEYLYSYGDDIGTVFEFTSTVNIPFTVAKNVGFRGIIFHWPDQVDQPGGPTVYPEMLENQQPATNREAVRLSFKDCTVVNAYDFINVGGTAEFDKGGNWSFDNCNIFALRRVFNLNNIPDVINFTGTNISFGAYSEELYHLGSGGGSGASLSVSSITRSGATATVTTAVPHQATTGQKVTIAGADQSEYNGTFVITSTGASTFTYTVSGSPASPATGTITADFFYLRDWALENGVVFRVAGDATSTTLATRAVEGINMTGGVIFGYKTVLEIDAGTVSNFWLNDVGLDNIQQLITTANYGVVLASGVKGGSLYQIYYAYDEEKDPGYLVQITAGPTVSGFVGQQFSMDSVQLGSMYGGLATVTGANVDTVSFSRLRGRSLKTGLSGTRYLADVNSSSVNFSIDGDFTCDNSSKASAGEAKGVRIQDAASSQIAGRYEGFHNQVDITDTAGVHQIDANFVSSQGTYSITSASSATYLSLTTRTDLRNTAVQPFEPTVVASAVNYPSITQSATGNPVLYGAAGDDTNIPVRLTSKGTSEFGSAVGFYPGGLAGVVCTGKASAVNYLLVNPGATTESVFIKAEGSDTDISLVLQGKGAGSVFINDALTMGDGQDVVLNTTTGTKIGTATSQKLGFWNATPVIQPTTGVAEATFVENSGGTAVNVDSTFDGYTMQQVVKALRNIGVLA